MCAPSLRHALTDALTPVAPDVLVLTKWDIGGAQCALDGIERAVPFAAGASFGPARTCRGA